MNNTIKDFTDLNTWKEAHKFVVMIYKYTKLFPDSEKFSLTDQIRRAAVSITSNIAEGFGRKSYREKIQFYYLAQGSLIESKNQLIVSRDVGYMSQKTFDICFEQANTAHKLLQGLIRSSKSFLKSGSNHKS